MLRTAWELTGFHDAQAARSVLAAAEAGQRPLKRAKKRRNDGQGFSAARRSRREQESQPQQERHSWGEREFASEGSRPANAGVALAPLAKVRRTLELAALPRGQQERMTAEQPKEKRIGRQQRRRPRD